MDRLASLAGAIALGLIITSPAQAEYSLRLEWVIQTQFAGFIVAHDKGYYAEEGLELELRPASPDLKPAVTVAQGIDTFGVGHPHQVLVARSNEVPLVTVLQHGQKSANVYISRKELGINQVEDVQDHTVGLWFGALEHEFFAMMEAAGVDPSDVTIIAQGFSIAPWMNGEYDVMMVTRYNELLQVFREGISEEELNILDPADYDSAMISSGGVFTTESMVEEHPEVVQAFVNASMRGWKEALADPEAAAKITLKYNDELDFQHQVDQLLAMRDLICGGPTLEGKFGYSSLEHWETSQRILLGANQIEEPLPLEEAFTNDFWKQAPTEFKEVACE